jgi:hypothetical protein
MVQVKAVRQLPSMPDWTAELRPAAVSIDKDLREVRPAGNAANLRSKLLPVLRQPNKGTSRRNEQKGRLAD